jgi:lysine biosynthesis protein LysW
MKSGKCLMCSANVPLLQGEKVGSLVYCPECDAELEVIKLDPVQLDWPLEDLDFDEEDFAYKKSYEDDTNGFFDDYEEN